VKSSVIRTVCLVLLAGLFLASFLVIECRGPAGAQGPPGVAAEGQVTLEVLNPRGVIPPIELSAPNPRLGDLAGKKIVLVPNRKHGADLFLDTVAELLTTRYPTATVWRLEQPARVQTKPSAAEQAELDKCDAFIHATGD